jgi:RNA polymerase sigma-70 factor (ECF subfamily)
MLQNQECVASRVSSSSHACAASSTRDERALLRGLLRGEEGAWRRFNDRYSHLLHGCIVRVTARFSRVLETDAVSEIYANLCVQLLANDMRKLRSFEAGRGTKFTSWLGMLATHAAYDYLRTVRREPRMTELTEAEKLGGQSDDPAEHTLLSERARLVQDVLRDFTERDRRFVELYFGEGLAPEHVARRMNISIKTVYSKKHKIMARLEALIGGERLAA